MTQTENPSLLRSILSYMPPGQFLRYIGVGVFNTLFGYCTFAIILFLLNRSAPPRFLYLTVIAASLLSTPLNITVAYFGYKFFVFKTSGNYLREWLKSFGVYGVGMLPGLLVLSALTRLLQTLIHRHGVSLRHLVDLLALHMHGPALSWLHSFSSGKAMAGYIAGALVQGFTILFSFLGHKNVTFRTKEPTTHTG